MRPRKWCFDLDDTLLPNGVLYHGPTWRCGAILCRTFGKRSFSPPDVLKLQFELQSKMVEKSGFVIDVYPNSWVRTYEVLAERAGIRVRTSVSERLFNVANRFKNGPYKAFPGVKTVLRGLRKDGHSVHLITAGPVDLQTRKFTEAGLADLFDSVHITLREKKSSLRQVVGKHSEDGIMVGDSKRSDILPAKELGMTTVWIPSQTWAYANADVKPDFEILSVRELPTVLRKLEKK